MHACASFVLCKRLVSIFKLFTSALCLISSSFWFIRFYVAVEDEPYENGGGRAIEERETCSGWERESREKNIPIFRIRDKYGMLHIRIINEILIKISTLMSAFFFTVGST